MGQEGARSLHFPMMLSDALLIDLVASGDHQRPSNVCIRSRFRSRVDRGGTRRLNFRSEYPVGAATLGWQVAHGPDIAPDTPNAEHELNEMVTGDDHI